MTGDELIPQITVISSGQRLVVDADPNGLAKTANQDSGANIGDADIASTNVYPPRRVGRPRLPLNAEFSEWIARQRPKAMSARSTRRWYWAWRGHKVLSMANIDGRFAWLLDAPLAEFAGVLAEAARFESQHGRKYFEMVIGVVCRKQMRPKDALAHLRKAMAIFDECKEPPARPAAFDRRPSAGGAP